MVLEIDLVLEHRGENRNRAGLIDLLAEEADEQLAVLDAHEQHLLLRLEPRRDVHRADVGRVEELVRDELGEGHHDRDHDHVLGRQRGGLESQQLDQLSRALEGVDVEGMAHRRACAPDERAEAL